MRVRRGVIGAGIAIAIAVLLPAAWWVLEPALEAAWRYGLRFEVPEGYTGWVSIRVNDPSCPAARIEHRTFVYPVDVNGRGCTSTPVLEGWRNVRYEEVLRGGGRREIPVSGFSGGGRVWQREYVLGSGAELDRFFVGTEQEWHGYTLPAP